MDHERHPGLDSRLVDKLEQARLLGMHLPYVPSLNVQLPKQFLNDKAFCDSRLFETQSYADRFWEIVAAIEARGIGGAVVTENVKSFQERLPASTTASRSGMQLLEYATNEAERRSVAKAIAEWADGDLIASHIASGNDLVCTEDRGRSAGGPSVFNDANRTWSARHLQRQYRKRSRTCGVDSWLTPGAPTLVSPYRPALAFPSCKQRFPYIGAMFPDSAWIAPLRSWPSAICDPHVLDVPSGGGELEQIQFFDRACRRGLLNQNT